jgi:Domain of unknown function (DUF1918)
MSASESTLRASPGDRLVIHGHRVGGPVRDGEKSRCWVRTGRRRIWCAVRTAM